MDSHRGATVPSGTASPAPKQPEPALVSWPRSVQTALSALLVVSLIVLAGKSLLHSLRAGPNTTPSQRIELNTASRAELMLLPGVGENLADRIAKARS